MDAMNHAGKTVDLADANNRLGFLLDRIENLQGKIGLGYGKDALGILDLIDQAHVRIQESLEKGARIPSEAAQYETILRVYSTQAAMFIREVGGAAAIAALRSEVKPDEAHWWWWPERIVAGKQKKGFQKSLRFFLVVMGVLAVLATVYQVFLKPDPKVIAAQKAYQEAESLASEGDYGKALVQVNHGMLTAPDDPELMILKGCLLVILKGPEQEAEALFDTAEKKVGNQVTFLVSRAQTYLNLGDLDLAKADLEDALVMNPKSSRAHLVLGQVYESQRYLTTAYAMYERASDLATADDDPVIAAQSRIKMGMLMQTMGMFQGTELINTPTPIP